MVSVRCAAPGGTHMILTHESPRVVPRKCGGWMALSAREGGLQIGVTALSEVEAQAKFHATRAGWQVLLGTCPLR